jgi:hypothetical protein
MIILRPGIIVVSLPALLALASAATLTAGALSFKILARTETADTIVLYQTVLVLAPPWRWRRRCGQPPTRRP